MKGINNLKLGALTPNSLYKYVSMQEGAADFYYLYCGYLKYSTLGSNAAARWKLLGIQGIKGVLTGPFKSQTWILSLSHVFFKKRSNACLHQSLSFFHCNDQAALLSLAVAPFPIKTMCFHSSKVESIDLGEK